MRDNAQSKLFASRLYGLTLTEMLTTIVLSALLILTLSHVLLASIESINWQSKLHEQQQKTELLIAILKHEISQAGYIGCQTGSHNFAIQSSLVNFINDRALVGDAEKLTVSHLATPTANLIKQEQNRLTITKNINVNTNDILMIADCIHNEVFQVASISNYKNFQIVTAKQKLSTTFSARAEVAKYVKNTFLFKNIKNYGELYLKDIHSRQYKLTSNLRFLTFTYLQRVANQLEETTVANNKILAVRIRFAWLEDKITTPKEVIIALKTL